MVAKNKQQVQVSPEVEVNADPTAALRHKLYKLYKIRNGHDDWAKRTDKDRADRLKKFADHFERETGIKLTITMQDKTYKPPFAISFNDWASKKKLNPAEEGVR